MEPTPAQGRLQLFLPLPVPAGADGGRRGGSAVARAQDPFRDLGQILGLLVRIPGLTVFSRLVRSRIL